MFADLMSLAYSTISLWITTASACGVELSSTASFSRAMTAGGVRAGASGLQGFDIREWWGVFGPAGVPAELAQRFSRDLAQVIGNSDVRARLASLGAEPVAGDPARLAEFLTREIGRWRGIISAGRIAVE